MDKIINGDCEAVLSRFPFNLVNLIVTSPPYAHKRAKAYKTVSAAQYVEWFLPKTEQFSRVLKPDGSFILNIKEGCSNGERQTYAMELVIALRKQGWIWVEEYIWHKRNCFPGKWPNRFRDAWEHCYHFTRQKKFAMYQDEVRVPVGDWSKARLKNLSETDQIRDESGTKSGFGKNVSNWVGRDMVYPTNVIHLPTESSNVEHSAAFPIGLPSWFIRLLTKHGDLVLDPFCGSGTTCVAAKTLGRHYIGVDVSEEYCELAKTRLEESAVRFPEAIK